jgi:hypothetical protein
MEESDQADERTGNVTPITVTPALGKACKEYMFLSTSTTAQATRKSS